MDFEHSESTIGNFINTTKVELTIVAHPEIKFTYHMIWAPAIIWAPTIRKPHIFLKFFCQITCKKFGVLCIFKRFFSIVGSWLIQTIFFLSKFKFTASIPSTILVLDSYLIFKTLSSSSSSTMYSWCRRLPLTFVWLKRGYMVCFNFGL